MRYDLTDPCRNCPFRSDRLFPLRPARATEIASELRVGKTFTCHKTTIEIEDADGDTRMADGDRAQHCAGALIVLAHEGRLWEGVGNRLAAVLGWFDPDGLNLSAPVFTSFAEWIDAFEAQERGLRA